MITLEATAGIIIDANIQADAGNGGNGGMARSWVGAPEAWVATAARPEPSA